MKTSGRMFTLLGAGVSVAAVALLIAVPAARSDKDPERKAAALKTLNGRIEAFEQTQLHARILGYVQKVQVDIGEPVKKGQVLAEQSVPEREAEVKQKDALATQAEAQTLHAHLLLKESKGALATIDAQLKEAEAGLKLAKAKLDEASKGLERAKKLLADGVVDAKVVDEKAAHVESAKAGLEEADDRIQTVQATREGGLTSVEAAELGIKTAAAQQVASRAEADKAMVMLNYARIVAPYDGIITQRAVDVGKLVGPPPNAPSEPLFTLTRTDKVRVVVAVSQNDAVHLRNGAEAIVRLGTLEFKGRVARIAGVLDPEKNTMRAEIDLPNPDGKLVSGMAVQVSIALSQD